jgi:hypothetical protein
MEEIELRTIKFKVEIVIGLSDRTWYLHEGIVEMDEYDVEQLKNDNLLEKELADELFNQLTFLKTVAFHNYIRHWPEGVSWKQ